MQVLRIRGSEIDDVVAVLIVVMRQRIWLWAIRGVEVIGEPAAGVIVRNGVEGKVRRRDDHRSRHEREGSEQRGDCRAETLHVRL